MTIYSVSQVTAYLREILEEDYELQALAVRGEISNSQRAASGHWYFTLSDRGAQLRCVLWRTQAEHILHSPTDGASYVVHGRISLYEERGELQLYVLDLQPEGEGTLYQQFMEIKNRLEQEGLFDAERKRAIPAYPNAIGIVTSPEAAALQDVMQVLRRRFPCARILLCPATVQGANAAASMIQALAQLVADGRPEVIILCRGGGSMEDLWPFNDEGLTRAVAHCPIPVVTGIGHETDFSLVDFAADLRAPTPSVAAELVTPDGESLLNTLQKSKIALKRRIREYLHDSANRLQLRQDRLQRASPLQKINASRQSIDDLRALQAILIRRMFTLQRERVHNRRLRLEGNNPSSILHRGYAYITRVEDGRQIERASALQGGERLNLNFYDGVRQAKAMEE
ncbi:MAG: exodeoxyribonuclease VII large subunit [Chloroflexi bacterium]|nr:exodeoxyribonuclease VII large subunit [Chloroflexota bacterium]